MGIVQRDEAVVDVVQECFPELEQLAKDVVANISDSRSCAISWSSSVVLPTVLNRHVRYSLLSRNDQILGAMMALSRFRMNMSGGNANLSKVLMALALENLRVLGPACKFTITFTQRTVGDVLRLLIGKLMVSYRR